MLFHWNGRMKRPLLSRPNEILWLGFDILIWWWNADVEWWGEEVSACSDKCKLARLQLQSIPAPTCRSVPLYPIFSGKWKYFRVQQRVVHSHCLRTLDLLRSDWLISWTGYIQNPVVLLPCLASNTCQMDLHIIIDAGVRNIKIHDPPIICSLNLCESGTWPLTSTVHHSCV